MLPAVLFFLTALLCPAHLSRFLYIKPLTDYTIEPLPSLYTPLAVLKIKDSGNAPGHWFFPEAREFSRPISAKSVFRQPGFPWNYPIGSRYHMTHFVGVAVAEPVPVPATMPRFFCAAKSSLTASYFRLIVSNLLSLHVQLPQTKAACPTPKYGDTSPSERIVCCRIGGCKQNKRRKGRFERARLIGWNKTRKMRATWRSFGVKLGTKVETLTSECIFLVAVHVIIPYVSCATHVKRQCSGLQYSIYLLLSLLFACNAESSFVKLKTHALRRASRVTRHASRV